MKILNANYRNNPFLCHLNINSLRYEITDTRHVVIGTGLEIVAISETKLTEEFRNQYDRKDLIIKRFSDFEDLSVEMICIEVTVARKKWLILIVYCPPKPGKTSEFSFKLGECLDKVTRKYKNIVVMGDTNIHVSGDKGSYNTNLS